MLSSRDNILCDGSIRELLDLIHIYQGIRMSQIIKNLASSGPLPPQIATSYVTDDGTAIPAANILNVNGSSTINDTVDGIETFAVPNNSNNLLIALTNRFDGTTFTIGIGTSTIMTLPLTSGAGNLSYRFQAEIVGRDTASGNTVGYTIFGSAKTNGTTASIVETPYQDIDQDSALFTSSLSIVASGNSILFNVTGTLGFFISYRGLGTYIVV
jgi:hypothetical protein